MTLASLETLKDTIADLCAQIDQPELRGIPIRTYIAAQEIRHQDALCADLADTNPTLATRVRTYILALRS